MADTPDRDEKTERPTDKRRHEASEKGDVLQSKELGTALVVLAGAAWLTFAGPWMVAACRIMLGHALTFDARAVTDFDPAQAALAMALPLVAPLATLFAMTMLAAVGAPALLGSLGFRWSAIGFKASKLDPMAGARRIFGMQGLVELGKSLVKVVLLGLVAYWLMRARMPSLMGMGRGDIAGAIGQAGSAFTLAVMVMAVALALIAGIDIPAQFLQRAGRLRMTKHEVKEEHKQSEGSPEMKMARRRRQHEMLSGSARKAVATATVVLTNPTHFAVALRYRPGLDVAPTVVARGRGATAQAIRELADVHAVPKLSYPLLARAIYFTTRPGQMIREDLYIAVATILAFVFNLDRALAEGVLQPPIEVPPAARFDEDGNVAS